MPFSTTIQHLIAGTAGGFFATGALYPLELVKTRMQVINDNSGTYRSLTKSFRAVIRNEGFRGLYQGMFPALLAASGSWGGYFFFYEQSKARKKAAMVEGSLGTADILASGVEAGVVMVLAFNPVWVVKTRLALQGAENAGSARRYTGLVDCLRTIVREEGVRGLYKGIVPALFLTSHGAIQFAIYELLKDLSKKYQGKTEQPPYISVLIGGTSKVIASTVTYPYQLVKSKLQQRDEIDPVSKETRRRYTGTLDCVKKVWRSEGAVGFFRGVLPNALKVAPSAAITFLVYEESMKLLS